MRIAINLDDPLRERLHEAARLEGVSFRDMLRRVLLRGLEAGRPVVPAVYETPTWQLGRVRQDVDLVKALDLASELDDEEVMRTLRHHR